MLKEKLEKSMTEETQGPEMPHGNPEESLTPSANERFKWYIIHAYSGFERKVKESIEGRVEAFGLQNRIGRVMIPTEPVTEVFNGTTDAIFFSVQANANQTSVGCLPMLGCIMALTLGGSWPPAAVSDGAPASGGTSGIVIDNVGGGSQQSNIYFTFEANSTALIPCNGASGVGCAVKLTRATLQ